MNATLTSSSKFTLSKTLMVKELPTFLIGVMQIVSENTNVVSKSLVKQGATSVTSLLAPLTIGTESAGTISSTNGTLSRL